MSWILGPAFVSGMAFSLEYTLGNYGKLRVTLAIKGMTQVLYHHGLRHEEDQEVQRTHKDYLPSLKSPPEERTCGKKVYFI